MDGLEHFLLLTRLRLKFQMFTLRWLWETLVTRRVVRCCDVKDFTRGTYREMEVLIKDKFSLVLDGGCSIVYLD